MRDLLTTFVNALLSAQADAVCGAGYGERCEDRVNSRNGYRHREFETRFDTLDVAVPKLRAGSLYPEWLLERRKRAERALTSVVATCTCSGSVRGGWTSWCRPRAWVLLAVVEPHGGRAEDGDQRGAGEEHPGDLARVPCSRHCVTYGGDEVGDGVEVDGCF